MIVSIGFFPSCIPPYLVGAYQPIAIIDTSTGGVVLSREWKIDGNIRSTASSFIAQLAAGTHTVRLTVTVLSEPIQFTEQTIEVADTSPFRVINAETQQGFSYAIDEIKSIATNSFGELFALIGRTDVDNTYDTVYYSLFIENALVANSIQTFDLPSGSNVVGPRLRSAETLAINPDWSSAEEIWWVDGISNCVYRLTRTIVEGVPVLSILAHPVVTEGTFRFVALSVTHNRIIAVSRPPASSYTIVELDRITLAKIRETGTNLYGSEIISCEATSTHVYIPIGCTRLSGDSHDKLYKIELGSGLVTLIASGLPNPDIIMPMGPYPSLDTEQLVINCFNPSAPALNNSWQLYLIQDNILREFIIDSTDRLYPTFTHMLGDKARITGVLEGIVRDKNEAAENGGYRGYPSFISVTSESDNKFGEVFLPVTMLPDTTPQN